MFFDAEEDKNENGKVLVTCVSHIGVEGVQNKSRFVSHSRNRVTNLLEMS